MDQRYGTFWAKVTEEDPVKDKAKDKEMGNPVSDMLIDGFGRMHNYT